MSHNVTISDIKITDIDALEAACAELRSKGVKISLHKDATYLAYDSSQTKVYPYVIKMEESKYDIGFEKTSDGAYVPVFDPFAGQIQRVVGLDRNSVQNLDLLNACAVNDPKVHIGKLMQTYGLCKAEAEAGQHGYTTQRVNSDGGQVQLVVTGY